MPLVATVAVSIKRMHGGCVPWRPVLKQVPPWRSQKLAAAFGRDGNCQTEQRRGGQSTSVHDFPPYARVRTTYCFS